MEVEKVVCKDKGEGRKHNVHTSSTMQAVWLTKRQLYNIIHYNIKRTKVGLLYVTANKQIKYTNIF
jgi:hypothetical protein